MSRAALIAVTLALIAAMLGLVPWLTRTLGPTIGYVSVFLLYWFLFCLPMGFIAQGTKRARASLSFEIGPHVWVPWAVGAQVALIAAASWVLLSGPVPIVAIVAALVFAVVNGFLEEFYWRGAFLAQGRGVVWFQAVGVALFTLWHVPLALAHGVVYEGGPAALIGGALGLGLFWSFIANKTGYIGWPIVSHILTNFAGFVGLITTNFIPHG